MTDCLAVTIKKWFIGDPSNSSDRGIFTNIKNNNVAIPIYSFMGESPENFFINNESLCNIIIEDLSPENLDFSTEGEEENLNFNLLLKIPNSRLGTKTEQIRDNLFRNILEDILDLLRQKAGVGGYGDTEGMVVSDVEFSYNSEINIMVASVGVKFSYTEERPRYLVR